MAETAKMPPRRSDRELDSLMAFIAGSTDVITVMNPEELKDRASFQSTKGQLEAASCEASATVRDRSYSLL